MQAPLIGLAELQGSIEKYARRFPVLEVSLESTDGLKKPVTLRRYRREAGSALQFSLVAPSALRALKPGPAFDEALQQTIEAQQLLDARFVVLVTPIEVTPADLPRRRLTNLVEALRAGFRGASDVDSATTEPVRIVWQPRGIWEAEEAAAFAAKLSIDLCFDPLIDPTEPFWHERLRYFRLVGVGPRALYPTTRLRWLAEQLHNDVVNNTDGAPRVVIFLMKNARKIAQNLHKLVAIDQAQGGGSVFMPRDLDEPDDESDDESEDDEDETGADGDSDTDDVDEEVSDLRKGH